MSRPITMHEMLTGQRPPREPSAFPSKSQRRNARRAEQAAQRDVEIAAENAELTRLEGMHTRALFEECGFTDAQRVFFERLMNHIDALGIDTSEE